MTLNSRLVDLPDESPEVRPLPERLGGVLRRIHAVQAGTHDCDGWQATLRDGQGAAVRCSIHAQRHT